MNLIKLMLVIISSLLIAGCNTQILQSDTTPKLEDIAKIGQLADAAYQNEEWENAIKYYRQLAQYIPRDPVPWFRLGNAYARLNQTGPALQSYQHALRLDEQNSKIWHNMGIMQLKQATNTFIEMQKHTQPGDPLHTRAQQVIEAISRLLNQDFGVEATN